MIRVRVRVGLSGRGFGLAHLVAEYVGRVVAASELLPKHAARLVRDRVWG